MGGWEEVNSVCGGMYLVYTDSEGLPLSCGDPCRV